MPIKSIGKAHVGQRTGFIYSQETVLSSTTALALSQNRLFFAPVYLPGFKIDRLMFEVTVAAAASSKGRIGFYSNENALPARLFYSSPEFSVDSVAVQTITIPEVTLPDDYCWVAWNCTGTPTCVIGAAARSSLLGATLWANTHRSLWVPRTYDGSLPAVPSGAFDTASMPLIGMLKAA